MKKYGRKKPRKGTIIIEMVTFWAVVTGVGATFLGLTKIGQTDFRARKAVQIYMVEHDVTKDAAEAVIATWDKQKILDSIRDDDEVSKPDNFGNL